MVPRLNSELILAKRIAAAALTGAPRFALKTMLHRLWPGGYGYMGVIRREASRTARPQRVKPATTGYESYDEYVTHQAQKYDEILARLGGFSNLHITQWRMVFFNSLKALMSILPRDAKILCVGARQGTEVEVLRDLGFCNAIGCDLNPGPANPYVIPGDFMKHHYPDGAFDAVYSNAIDHAFDLDDFFKEQARIVRSGGYGVFDFADFASIGGSSDFEVQSWDNTDEPVGVMRRHFPSVISDQMSGKWRTVIASKP
jgi:SAM-dependent methyltransferase